MKRTSVDGVETYVMNVTVRRDVYEALLKVATEESIPVTRVARAVIMIGTSKVVSEYEKRDRGEDNRIANIRRLYKTDRRTKQHKVERKVRKLGEKVRAEIRGRQIFNGYEPEIT